MSEIEEIVWDQSYNTGVTEIDEQHQILIKTLNTAQRKLRRGFSAEILDQITKDLLNYALYHFECEEEMMLENSYNKNESKEYKTHIKQHRDFSAKIISIRNSMQLGQQIDHEGLINYLKNWLINHINDVDKKFTHYIDKKQ